MSWQKVALEKMNRTRLAAARAAKFVTKGIVTETGDPGVCTALPVTSAGELNGGVTVREIGLVPTAEFPPNTLPPDCVENANSVPIFRAKEREAWTTRASISTCCDFRSSWRNKLSIFGIEEGMSLTISVFERASAKRSPRGVRNFLSVATMASALA